jgi:hypothetical protein
MLNGVAVVDSGRALETAVRNGVGWLRDVIF